MTNQKVAIITGGSSGIGRATAVTLAKESIKVVIAARRAKEGEETAQLVNDAGSENIFVKTDVAIGDDVKSLVEKTVKTYGRLDCAFNNAGMDESMITPFVEQSSDIFDRVMKINVKGVLLCMKYEIPEMIRNGGGAKVICLPPPAW
jgi:NAD(P)-dependent dehydrogenase (short-subunit alcohol dehydrogenase family)